MQRRRKKGHAKNTNYKKIYRKSAPYFGLYVLNRLSIENFSLHLTDFEEINLTDEFIIYQTSEGNLFSLKK